MAPHPQFDLVGLGLVPGKEWKGPREIFVAEEREGEMLLWANCSFWTDRPDGPLYILTEDPNVFFSYDGYALLPLLHAPTDRRSGEQLALARLRAAARRAPTDVESQRMMQREATPDDVINPIGMGELIHDGKRVTAVTVRSRVDDYDSRRLGADASRERLSSCFRIE